MTELELDYSNTAAYSPRERTVAAKWVDKYIDEDVKTERLARLNEHNRECCLHSNKKYIGREMEVLIEKFEGVNEGARKGKNVITGRTRNNKIVHIPYDQRYYRRVCQRKNYKCTHLVSGWRNGLMTMKRFRFLTSGESHGKCLTAIIEGVPA